jgi:hypothetical protein
MKTTHGKSLAERLDHYSIPVPHCGCHIWLGGLSGKGYGIVSTGGQGSTMAHRAAWQVARGPIPKGMHVLHTCDVPSCINPDHLFLGTNQDNVDDKVRKGRAKLAGKVNRRGQRNPSAVLTEAEVLKIISSPLSAKRLSEHYEVHISTIFRIKSGEKWGHLQPGRIGASSAQAAE